MEVPVQTMEGASEDPCLRRLLSMAEVATILGISLGRAYELARRGIIPSVRLGRQVRVDRIALEKWLSGELRAEPAPGESALPSGFGGGKARLLYY